jgi:murein DD-endopeptidase MepM/ murein hydrolase activator NlpD
MRFRFVVVVLLAGVVAAPGLAAAQTSSPGGGPNLSASLQNQITEASTEEIQALAALQDVRNRELVLTAKVQDLNAQLLAAQAKLTPLQGEADRITGQFNDVQAQERTTQGQLDTAQHLLNASAAGLLISAREGNGYASIVSAGPTDLGIGEKYLHHVAGLRKNLVEKVRVLRDQIDAERRQVETQKARADEVANEAQAARDQISSLVAQIKPAQDQAAQQQAQEQQSLSAIQARKGEFEAQLNALQAASDSIAQLLRNANSGPGVVGHCDARPVPGAIISGFGPRVDPISGAHGFHPGDDLQATYGTPIHACKAGTVMIAGPEGGYGNAVVIDHGGGMATLYGHQSRVGVTVGQHVSANDVIGFVGSTGYSTGPHLHFEVRLSGNPVDPTSYLA